MTRIAVAAMAGLLLGYSVNARQGTYAVYGQGNQSCGRWTQDNKEQRDTHLFSWAVGFVSGAGFNSPKPLRATDSDAIAAWIDQYCGAHPLDNVAKAAGALVEELEKRSR